MPSHLGKLETLHEAPYADGYSATDSIDDKRVPLRPTSVRRSKEGKRPSACRVHGIFDIIANFPAQPTQQELRTLRHLPVPAP